MTKYQNELLTQVLNAYSDYENKMISKGEVIEAVRDAFYLEAFGLTYDEWAAG